MRAVAIGLALWAVPLAAQTVINGSRMVKGAWDASGATSTKPVKSGASIPIACSSGELFFNTTAAAGQNLYLCQPDNTWTQLSAGAGGGGSEDWGAVTGAWINTLQLTGATAGQGNGPLIFSSDFAGMVYTLLVRFPRMTFNTLMFTVGTPCSACAARFALYATDKSTRVWDSGAITDTAPASAALGTAGAKVLNFNHVTIAEGWYYLVWSADTSSLQMWLSSKWASYDAASPLYMFNDFAASGGNLTAHASGSGSSFDLPALLGAIRGSGGLNYIPMLYWSNQ